MYIFSSLFTYMVVWVSDFVMVNILLWCVCVCVFRVTRPCYITRHGCAIFQTIKKFTIMCILFTY